MTPARAAVAALPLLSVALALLTGEAAWLAPGWVAVVAMAVWPKRGRRG